MRVDSLDLGDCFQIETYDHHAAAEAVSLDQLDDRGGKLNVSILCFVGLHFYVDDGGTRGRFSKEIEDLIQSGHNLAVVFGSREAAMTGIEPTAHIRPTKFS